MVDFHYKKVPLEDDLIGEVFRLRYKVYCLECGFEDPADYASGIETDEFDEFSTHFCAYEEISKSLVGTARIILPSHRSFPILKHFQINENPYTDIAENKYGEISRLAISKDYRRRMIDRAIYSNNVIDFQDEKEKRDRRKHYETQLVTGLYHCIYRESLALDLTHLYAVMSKGLHYLLTSWGLVWHPIGPEKYYHGLRTPYVASVAENMAWFDANLSATM
ncbi:MAG TPA: PEP-CTERM/exosortase system-associated acyltransferase [Malonomonas sp.]